MTTTTDSIKATARRFIDAVDNHDWTTAKDLAAPSCRVRVAGQDLDREAWLGMGQMFAAAFPDGNHQIQALIAEGDQLVMHGVWRGTHTGPFQGAPASGRAVAIDMVIIDRIVEGRVVQHFGIFDTMVLMQQIGAVPGH